jgi:hypothetical protein
LDIPVFSFFRGRGILNLVACNNQEADVVDHLGWLFSRDFAKEIPPCQRAESIQLWRCQDARDNLFCTTRPKAILYLFHSMSVLE